MENGFTRWGPTVTLSLLLIFWSYFFIQGAYEGLVNDIFTKVELVTNPIPYSILWNIFHHMTILCLLYFFPNNLRLKTSRLITCYRGERQILTNVQNAQNAAHNAGGNMIWIMLDKHFYRVTKFSHCTISSITLWQFFNNLILTSWGWAVPILQDLSLKCSVFEGVIPSL